MSFTFIHENQENGVLAPPTTTFMSIREHMRLLGGTRAAHLEVGSDIFPRREDAQLVLTRTQREIRLVKYYACTNSPLSLVFG